MSSILIVDDDENIRNLFQDILENMTCEVATAATAAEATELLNNRVPDLVFLDFNMPGGTGAEVIKFIHQTASLSKVKIVVVTANPIAERTVEELGIDLFLEKPVAIEDIVAFANRLTIGQ
jgi:CheY-like chemotaxis protein